MGGAMIQADRADANEDGDQGGDQDVHLGLLAHRLAELSGDDGHEQDCQRPARAAQGVGGKAHRHQGKEDQRRGLKGVADGHRHGRAAHGRGQAAHGVGDLVVPAAQGGHHLGQEGDVELGADGVDNGTDEQGAEQALGHGPQGVDAVALDRDDDILPL